ncbi:hypothetical protein QFZ75_006976 [Streptomyces sp. V3I8]|uniref:transposase family protein n=1 Tax=Streptomyces sp. V3I8 TaxID=3042279 RepID=UPI0027819D88|nr:transposase family protein [Streptomyces sp. V3I8]MDQ1040560.1 hypothetical protein [Streptomyces sp. V3I8]
MPAEASSLIPPALDQLREHPEGAPDEVPGQLERLAQVPDPRDPRGVRHALVVVLALTACAVPAGATSLPAVGEWITDAPPHVLEHVGVRLDPLFPKRSLPAETTVRRLLARIDGDALDLAVGRWLADRRNRAEGRLRGLAVDGKSLRGAAKRVRLTTGEYEGHDALADLPGGRRAAVEEQVRDDQRWSA